MYGVIKMSNSYENHLTRCITRTEELAGILKLDEEQTRKLSAIQERYPFCIPQYYLDLIDWKDPADPIRKMCIPSIEETDMSGSFDTSGEADNTVITGLQHKYDETALILSTSRCAMYCRHCFRKRLVGLSDEEIATHMDEMFQYIQEHEEITNVLISGGDSFMNPNKVLRHYLAYLADINHLDCIRFGTRMPVVYPMRIYEDTELLQMLKHYSSIRQIYVVTQFNHPREFTPQARQAVEALKASGVIVKNQTVLLRGVNDTPHTLGQLLKELTAWGIAPYYIFQCRPVTGVKNQFQVPLKEGVRIVEEAKAMQNGLGKCVRYCMSHPTGKIEILGEWDGRMMFKYHEARDKKDLGTMFLKALPDDACWLDGPERQCQS